MEELKQIFETAAQKNRMLKEARAQNEIIKLWYQILDKKFTQNLRPARFSEGTLLVYVSSPVWANQLSLMEKDICQKLNTPLGKEIVREIKFKVSHLLPEEVAVAAEEGQAREKGEGEGREIDEILQSIEKKRERVTREKKKKGQLACAICGELHGGRGEASCSACRAGQVRTEKQNIRRYLRKTPWASFAEIKEAFPKIKYEAFSREKRVELAYLKEEIEKGLREVQKEKAGSAKYKKLISKLKDLSYGAAMLRSGQGPEKIKDNLNRYLDRRVKKLLA